MFIVMLFIAIFGSFIMPCMAHCCPRLRIADFEVDQMIDNYWSSLDEDDKTWSLEEERNGRENLGKMRILTDEAYERVQFTEMTKGTTLQGVHAYDILANPLYVEQFQYVTAALPNRNDFIIDDDSDEENDAAQSDIVRVALNLAYLTEENA